MKNLHFSKKKIFIKNGYLTQKNQNPNKIAVDKLVELTTSSSNMFISNFNLSNRHVNLKNKSFFPIGINYKTNKTFGENLKLCPIQKIKLFENKELANITYDIINTKKFKRTINQSSQSEFYANNKDLDAKIRKIHYFKINELLNKKMAIRIYNPKLKKINFNINQEKNTFLENLLKLTSNEAYRRQINIKLKPLKNYTKSLSNNRSDDIISNAYDFKTRNNSPIFHKVEKPEKSNNTYETAKSFDKRNKIIYANKLIINDIDVINNNNEINDLFIKKRNDKQISSDNEIVHLRDKYKFNKNKRIRKIKFISYDDVKQLSKKGFDKLMSRKYENYKQKIHNAEERVEVYKKQFQNLLETKKELYEKNKNDVLSDEILNVY